MRHLITANEGFIKYVVMENEPKPDFQHDLLSEFQSDRRRGGADSETYSERSLDSSLYRTRSHVREIILGAIVAQPRKFNETLNKYSDHGSRFFPAFLTLTFADRDTRADSVLSLTGRFFDKLSTKLGYEVPYLAVVELHKSGVPHVHCVVFALPYRNILMERSTRFLATVWGRGFVDVRPLESGKKAANYIGKYLTKEYLPPTGFNKRRYSSSRNLSTFFKFATSDPLSAAQELAKLTGSDDFRLSTSISITSSFFGQIQYYYYVLE